MSVKFDPNAVKADAERTIDKTFDKARGPLKAVIAIGTNVGLQYATTELGLPNVSLPASLTDRCAEVSVNQSQECSKKSAALSIDLYAKLFGKK